MKSKFLVSSRLKQKLQKAENEFLTAVAVIRDAKQGDCITLAQIQRYCDEAIRAISEFEELKERTP